GVCSLKHQNHAAVRFYEEAFAKKPQLAEDPPADHRYRAACAAALAGCGAGKDAGQLDGKERARLRRLALGWLRAALAARPRRLDKEPDRSATINTLRAWLGDPHFAGVRGSHALAKLPEAERQPWQELWSKVAATVARVQAKVRS